jgi:predicted dehydrogenase
MVNAAGGTGYGTHETLTYLTMKYERFLAHLKSSWISPIKERRIIIGGTKKMLIFDDVKTIDRLTIYDSGIEIAPTDIYGAYEFRVRTGDIHIPHLEFRDSLLASIEAFADSVNTGVQSITGPTQASRVIEILERAMQSMRN